MDASRLAGEAGSLHHGVDVVCWHGGLNAAARRHRSSRSPAVERRDQRLALRGRWTRTTSSLPPSFGARSRPNETRIRSGHVSGCHSLERLNALAQWKKQVSTSTRSVSSAGWPRAESRSRSIGSAVSVPVPCTRECFSRCRARGRSWRRGGSRARFADPGSCGCPCGRG